LGGDFQEPKPFSHVPGQIDGYCWITYNGELGPGVKRMSKEYTEFANDFTAVLGNMLKRQYAKSSIRGESLEREN
jgi:hypothetical protein